MDIGAFVQENRKWLIGCVIGVIAYLIADAVIGSVYDDTAAGRGLMTEIRKLPNEMYDRDARDLLISESEELKAERQRLQGMLAFTRGEEYQLEPGSEPGRFLFQAGRRLEQGILNAADERDIEVTAKEIAWPVRTGVDEIKQVLFGLELLDETASRLLAAHDRVRLADPDAIGLRSILSLRTESKQRGRAAIRGRRGRSAVDLRDYVDQEHLQFKFEADAATIAGFFESCREPGRTLVLERVQMEQPDRIGDPVVVQGSLTGIAFKEQK